MRSKFLQKIVIIPLLFLIAFGPALAPFAQGFNFPERYDLVAILVEQGVYSDTADYAGMSDDGLPQLLNTTLKARVDRYGMDLQNALPGTRAVLIQVDRFEKPENVAAVLERLYFEGDPEEPNRTAYLKGVVIIGEVPLPVVNKKGNRFISLYPYTDFEQKAYTWNQETGDFEKRSENPNPQPEIWHGVIRPPVSTKTAEGKGMLATYFDKNHLYHFGLDDFTRFDKRVFFQDFFTEHEKLNPLAYKNYLNYIEHQGDVAYMRYTKELFNDLSGPIEQELAEGQAEAAELGAAMAGAGIPMMGPPSDPPIPSDAQNDINDARAASESDDIKEEIPDIMTKITKMSDNLMSRFNELFTSYVGEINDLMIYTGRYSTTDVDSPINLITNKDAFTLGYLKAVNDMVENKIDEIIEEDLQRSIQVVKNANIEVTSVVHKPLDSDDDPFTVTPAVPGITSTPAEFINFSAPLGEGAGAIRPPSIMGRPMSEITSVDQCSLYRGSRGTGPYSKLVEANHARNLDSAMEADNQDDDHTPEVSALCELAEFVIAESIDTDNCPAFVLHGGCFYVSPPDGYDLDDPEKNWCFPENATDPIFDIAGTAERLEGPQNFDNFRSCFDFHEKEVWEEHTGLAQNYLDALDDGGDDMEERMGMSRPRGLDETNRHPDALTVFSSGRGGDFYPLTLGAILRGLGWNLNGGGWEQRLNEYFAEYRGGATTITTNISHPQLQSAAFRINLDVDHPISSVFYHKEPTTETLNAQGRSMITKSLPVDNPRYVTFQDYSGNVRRITYPDLFSAESPSTYIEQLRNIENQINAAPRSAGAPPPCNNCLTSLVGNLPEQSTSPAGMDILLTRSNRSKVSDAINWKNMDIDTKHEYISEYYLDSRKNAYTGERPNGYELIYFNGEGNAQNYEFSMNKDIPEENDDVFGTGQNVAAALITDEEIYEDDPENPFDDAPEDTSGQGGYDLFSWTPPPVSPWWERMIEWRDDLVETMQAFNPGDSAEDFYAAMEAERERLLEEIKEESSEVESNLLTADELDFSKIKSIKLMSDSNTVVVGKKVDVKLELRDEDGALVNDEFGKVTLVLEGSAQFSNDVEDDSSDVSGTQITMLSGTRNIGIVMPDEPARIKVIAQITGGDERDELVLDVLEDAKLVLQTATNSIAANGASQTTINVFAWDDRNRVITSAQGRIRLSVSNELYGTVSDEEITISGGRGTFLFTAGTKAGTVSVNATSSVIDSGSLTINLLPGPPTRIALRASEDTLVAIPGAQVEIEAGLYDAFNNMVNTDFSTFVDFRISEAGERFGALTATNVRSESGIAVTNLGPREETGPVNIIAESPGLIPGAITVAAKKEFGQRHLSGMDTQGLTAAVLGIPGGDVTEQDYFGGWLLDSGRMQAVTSLTAPPKQYKTIFEVNDRGALRFPDPSRISTSFLPGNNFTMMLSDNRLQADIAKLTIYTIRDGEFAVTEVEDPARLADGIYMRRVGQEPQYKVDLKKGALRLVKDDSERVEIQTNGYFRIFDNDFSVRPRGDEFPVLEVLDKETPVAEIYFVQRFDQDVRAQNTAPTAPGVYVEALRAPPHVRYKRSFTGSSTSLPRGISFYDTTEALGSSEAPGFGYQSLEDSLDGFGVGFTEDNKFALLFAAGEMFGEANRSFASDIGIVLGDPLVRVNNRPTDSSFSQDIGKLLYAGGAEIRGIIGLDYNTDGYEDVFIVQGDGKIRLIQNNGGYDQLKDQGFILDINSGIQDITKVDFNNDNQMDLVIAGTESCRVGDTCLDVYENRSGSFVRRNIHFDQIDKVITVRAEDLNRDNYKDLIIADAGGDIRVIYNRRGEFEDVARPIGNIGLQINRLNNLIGNVLIRYSGMTSRNSGNPVAAQNYFEMSINVAGQMVPRDFLYANFDTGVFATSTKFGEDLNGGVVRGGDKIRYTITLHNSSGATRTNVMVSDVVAESIELDPASIQCTDCGTQEMGIEQLSGDQTRPYLFKNISVPARGTRRIIYEGTFRGDTSTTAGVNIAFSERFSDSSAILNAALHRDEYPDISVSKDDNPTGQVRYFYSTGVASDGTMQWGSALSSPPVPPSRADFEDKTGLHLPDPEEITDFPVNCEFPRSFPPRDDEEMDSADECESAGGEPGDPVGPPPTAQNKLTGLQETDSDGDGLQDTLDNIDGALEGLADATQAAIANVTCAAGCIALPVNAAFLSPGFFSILGTPDGYDIGLPVFGWGAPSLVPVWPPSPALSTGGGRFYVSPTLTGGIGFGLCLGPFGTPKNCYSFGVNPLDLIAPNVCEGINGAVSGAVAAATSVVSDINEGMTLSIGGGSGSAGGTNTRDSSGSGLSNYSMGNYETPVSTSTNIRIPGFPSILTDWWSAQMEEFTDKVLSVPDIYLIYPALDDTFVGSFKATEEFNRTGNVLTNVLSYLNSVPLLDIETQEVLFKVPVITRKEIELFKADARQWLEDERKMLDDWMNLMGCFGIPQAVGAATGTETVSTDLIGNLEVCRFVSLNMERLISTVGENMERLDDWILFPKKILQYREIEAFYLGQIINYLDTIIEFTGGWVKRNIARVKQWRRAVRRIKDMVENWRAILDLMIDYNESCDNCKTERYSLKDLILRLFIAIPTPPVIPLPKLPDIIVDVSKIQAGLRIQWPDVKFKPSPMVLPRIPRIMLGVNITPFNFTFPEIPVIPAPPALPQLPSLPELQLPQLPDLPPPPTVPGLPASLNMVVDILKQIMRILCLIRLGFIPTDEILLKTRIEEITARGLNPVLPIDTLFRIQTPAISTTYVDQLIVTAFTNLNFDTSFIQTYVEGIAQTANALTTNLTEGYNSFMDALSKQAEKVTNPTINIGPSGGSINYNPNEQEQLTRDLSGALGTDAAGLVNLGMILHSAIASLDQSRVEYQKIAEETPREYVLDMRTEPFDKERIATEAEPGVGVNSGAVLPFQKRLKAYRDNLAAYVDSTGRLIADKGAADELADFSRYIAGQKSAFIDTSLKRYIAGENIYEEGFGQPANSEPVKVGKFDVENIDWVDAETDDEPRMLAYGLTSPPEISTPGLDSGGSGSAGSPGEVQNIGIYYVEPGGEGRRLINYTREAGQPSELADIDLDDDGDKDKIYSYGRNVFVKRNDRRIEIERRDTFRSVDMEFWTIYELLPKGMSPNFPKVLDVKAHEASFTFEQSNIKDPVGFEVLSRNSPLYFENRGNMPSFRTHLLKDFSANKAALEQTVKLIDPDGFLLIADRAPETLTANIGDTIQTGDNSSVTISASDGTLIHVGENAHFLLAQGGSFELSRGNVEIEIPEAGSSLVSSGTIVGVADSGEVRVRFFDGSEVKVKQGASFTVPEIIPVMGAVGRVTGSAFFTGSKREYKQSASGVFRVGPGELLHPLNVVNLIWNVDNLGERKLTLSKNIMIPVPDSFANGIDIEVDGGVLEIIRAVEAEQPVAAGMALLYGDSIQVRTGAVTLEYEHGGQTILNFNEKFTLQRMGDPENPTAELQVDPAFYFTKVYAFDEEGNRSTSSEKLLLAPQVCGDTVPPFANFGSAEYTIGVGKTLKLDASRSFDSFSNVISYWMDTDVETDSDGDGNPTNDQNIWSDKDPAVDTDEDGNFSNDGDSPAFTIGPYSEVGQNKMRLIVRDEALNQGYQDITVNVVTPRIVLDGPPLKSNIISGYVEPAEKDVPITLARLRPGPYSVGWEMITTPSADEGGQYFTDNEGVFTIEDADFRERLVVRNSEGKIVAEVNTSNGRITITDDRYETRVMFTEPGIPTRIGVFLKTDPATTSPLTYVYFVPDVNTDVTIDGPDVIYNAELFKGISGVHIKPLEKAADLGINFRILPGNDLEIPGAAVGDRNQDASNRIVIIDVNGDIVLRDIAMSIREKAVARPSRGEAKPLPRQNGATLEEANTEPVLFELLYDGNVIAEVFIVAHVNVNEKVEIVAAPVVPVRQEPINARRTGQPFDDIAGTDPFGAVVTQLYRYGIFSGYRDADTRGDLLFKPDNKINRAEFTQVALKMLCIVPRPEAHTLPSPFYDVLNTRLWFYPVLKEGNIREFISGYVGEARTNPQTGVTQTPFKPQNDITRAEAVTVVLAALYEQDIIDLDGVDFTPRVGGSWYDRYVEIAQNIKPYLVDQSDAPTRAFLITAQEASDPTKQITRREFATIADRVLLFYNCYLLDGDEDTDGDGCSNAREYEAGTDHNNADTDGGSVNDCTEIERGTNPVNNPYDDVPQEPRELLSNDEGIFILNPRCGNVCPCRATLGPGEDLQPGDIIFAAITGSGGLPIYAKSNEETY